MSVAPEEISAIEEWLVEQLGTPVSRETIRKMCQGPMKDIFLNFLVPRFRTDEQIKTIRSNLFLHDLEREGDGNEVHQQIEEEQLKKKAEKLTGDIEEVCKENGEITERCANLFANMIETNEKMESEIIQALATYEKAEFKFNQATERVRITNDLLKEIPNLEPPNASNQNAVADDTNQRAGLKALYENAIELFDVYCGTKQHSSEVDVVHALIEKVDQQTWDLANSGIAPGVIESWVDCEQELAFQQLNALEMKFANVMSHEEKFTAEVEDLNNKLMAIQVNLRAENQEMKGRIEDLKKRLAKKLEEAMKDENVDLKKLLEQLNEDRVRTRARCMKELESTVARWERALANDDDVLGFICESSGPFSLNFCDDQDSSLTAINRARESMNDEASSSASSPRFQETLEELTSSLVKSYPICKEQLKATLRDNKRLMLEMFPKFCDKLENYMKGNADFLSSVPTETTLDDPVSHHNIPRKMLLLGTPFEEEHSFPKEGNQEDGEEKEEDDDTISRLVNSDEYLSELFQKNAENEKKTKAISTFWEGKASSVSH